MSRDPNCSVCYQSELTILAILQTVCRVRLAKIEVRFNKKPKLKLTVNSTSV